jgi:hypothetical protein
MPFEKFPSPAPKKNFPPPFRERANLEKGARENGPEKLDIYDDLAIRIHDLYYKRLLNKKEAEKLMKYLKDKSDGRDNIATLKLIDVLDEVDLYLKEKLVELSNKRSAKSK